MTYRDTWFAGPTAALSLTLFLLAPAPALALTGGPDGAGYQFADSDEPNGPTPNWIDISGIGTDAGAGSTSAARARTWA